MFSIIQPLFPQETIHIPNVYLELGFEFGTQIIKNLAYGVSVVRDMDLGHTRSHILQELFFAITAIWSGQYLVSD